jgi:hypothetical protein
MALGTMDERMTTIDQDAKEESRGVAEVKRMMSELGRASEELLKSSGYVSENLEDLKELASDLDAQSSRFTVGEETPADEKPTVTSAEQAPQEMFDTPTHLTEGGIAQ